MEDNTVEVDGQTFDADDLREALDEFEGADDAVVGDIHLSNDTTTDRYIYVSDGETITYQYVSDLRDALPSEFDGVHLRVTKHNSQYGATVPINAEYKLVENEFDYVLHFNEEDDVSDMDNVSGSGQWSAGVAGDSIELVSANEL
jgi:hypothetical protein